MVRKADEYEFGVSFSLECAAQCKSGADRNVRRKHPFKNFTYFDNLNADDLKFECNVFLFFIIH